MAWRRRKRRPVTLAGGETAPGAVRARSAGKREPDPRAVVIAARTRQSGAIDSGKRAVDQITDPLHASDMGRCILILADDDLSRLRETWDGLCAAWDGYCRRILGRSPGAQGAAIAMVPDRMDADPSYRIDLRSADERDRAARSAWAAWVARIDALPTPMHRWAIRAAMGESLGDSCLWRDQAPTDMGRNAVAALRMMGRESPR